MARLYREAPLNSIWEGSGNVQCLDVLRAIGRSPESLAALLAEIDLARGADRRLDAALERLRRDLAAPAAEAQARRLVEGLATARQGSLLIRHAPAAVAGAFCASRLDERGLAFGTLPPGSHDGAILQRHAPDDPGGG